MSIQGDAGVIAAVNEVLNFIRKRKVDYEQCPDAISALEEIEEVVKRIRESAEAGW